MTKRAVYMHPAALCFDLTGDTVSALFLTRGLI